VSTTPETESPESEVPEVAPDILESSELAASENGKEEDAPELLNLTALAPTRRMVKIPTKETPAGETFELRLVDDFGIEDQQGLIAWGKEFQKLMNSDTQLKEAQRERLRWLLNHLFMTILDAPDAVKKDITDAIKNRVIQAFTWAPVLAQQELQSQVITRLIDRGALTQEQVDEILEEMRAELASRTTGS
jgi:hypothetical protein